MFGADGRAIFCQPDCQSAYERLYNIESYLRHILRWELVGAFAESWQNPIAELVKAAEERRAHEGTFRVIDADERNIMSYLMLNDIRDTMLEPSVWRLFKSNWPPVENFKTTFQLLNALRNKNAHYRPVTSRDLRTLDRIQEDLSDFTAHYGKARRLIRSVEPDALPEPFKATIVAWAGEIASGEGTWGSLTLGRVGPYLCIMVATRTGVLPSNTIELILKARADCFFAGFDPASGRIDLYLPMKINKAQSDRLIAAVRALKTEEVEVDAALAEEGPRLDYVFPIDVELPVGFRL